jgi:hypothetical protein
MILRHKQKKQTPRNIADVNNVFISTDNIDVLFSPIFLAVSVCVMNYIQIISPVKKIDGQ